ncbi:MAG TPA: site-specific integrase [Candidatus Acidoferrales bacterium]|nr:site-specific integrase [Candidatus Acidoferrales bacterium]
MKRRTAARSKPSRRRGRPAGGGGQAKILTAAELTRVDKCLKGMRNEHRNRALFYLQLATGVRVGELAALNVGDVLHRQTIRREFNLGTADAKYCKPRTIYLEHPKAREALLTYLRERREDLAFRASEPLFVGQKENAAGSYRISANSLVHLFAQLYAAAGIVGASSHSGRRWFMTELARGGVHPRIIQQRAGHTSLATTQRYIEVTPDQERRALRVIKF